MGDQSKGAEYPCNCSECVKELREELAELRAFKAACEKQEAVAWSEFNQWMHDQITSGTVIGDPGWWASRIYKKFIRLDPEAAQLRMQVSELEGELARWKYAHKEWSDKTEWVQESAEPKELGKHRADVIKDRLAAVTAQRDELGAALEGLRNDALTANENGYGSLSVNHVSHHCTEALAIVREKA